MKTVAIGLAVALFGWMMLATILRFPPIPDTYSVFAERLAEGCLENLACGFADPRGNVLIAAWVILVGVIQFFIGLVEIIFGKKKGM